MTFRIVLQPNKLEQMKPIIPAYIGAGSLDPPVSRFLPSLTLKPEGATQKSQNSAAFFLVEKSELKNKAQLSF